MKGIKSVYVNIVTCVRAKKGESRYFRIDSGVRQVCVMSPWLFNLYIHSVMELEMGMGEGSEISGGGKRVEIA